MPDIPRVGNSTPIFVPRDNGSTSVRAGQDYFLVQIHAAQAAFKGSFWARVKQLIITSNVSLSRPGLMKESMKAIQRSRDARPGHATQLGLRPNLIGLIPAVVTDFSVSIDFIVDSEDRLKGLAKIINDDNFLATVSLAPGAAMVAKTVSNLTEKVIREFLPEQERVPILQFSGDFNITADDRTGALRDGYYVIMGTRDPENPLPPPDAPLTVANGGLLVDGRLADSLSYVILDVQRIGARTRDRNDGAAWDEKLREAEDEARLPLDDDPDRTWKKCRELMREAQTLLRADVNYLRSEAEAILLSTLQYCKETIFSRTRSFNSPTPDAELASKLELVELKLEVEPQTVPSILEGYARQVRTSRQKLSQLSM